MSHTAIFVAARRLVSDIAAAMSSADAHPAGPAVESTEIGRAACAAAADSIAPSLGLSQTHAGPELSAAALSRVAAAVALDDPTPKLIGPYSLIEIIGQGGMGEVWRAQQSHPIRRTVALKLVKLGMATREVV